MLLLLTLNVTLTASAEVMLPVINCKVTKFFFIMQERMKKYSLCGLCTCIRAILVFHLALK